MTITLLEGGPFNYGTLNFGIPLLYTIRPPQMIEHAIGPLFSSTPVPKFSLHTTKKSHLAIDLDIRKKLTRF